MRRTKNDMHGIGAAFQNGGHRIDHDFDALVRREKSERQDDGPAAEAEFGLRLVRLDEWEVGNPVRDDLDLFRRYPVESMQQLPPFLGHDDDPRRRIDYPVQDATLHRRRPGKNRMKRRDDRHGQPRE